MNLHITQPPVFEVGKAVVMQGGAVLGNVSTSATWTPHSLDDVDVDDDDGDVLLEDVVNEDVTTAAAVILVGRAKSSSGCLTLKLFFARLDVVFAIS